MVPTGSQHVYIAGSYKQCNGSRVPHQPYRQLH